MVRYFALMYTLLAAAFVSAVVMLPPPPTEPVSTCNAVADYPVQRLADRGDIDAMAFLGERMVTEDCKGQTHARGMQYLEDAAAAGHPDAATVLIARQADAARVFAPVSVCAALMGMMLPGVEDPHLTAGACH